MINLITTPFPVLSTARLFLRMIESEDKDVIFKLRSDAEVNKYLDREPAKSVNDALNFISQILKGIGNNEMLYWVVCLEDKKNIAGTIGLFNVNEAQSEAEIGYELLPQYQGQGIMNEALAAIFDYAFNTLQLKTINAILDPANKSSIKLLERYNFKLQPERIENGLVLYKLSDYNRD